ncbi:tyrosine-protein phosphatase 69D [Orussus abietinus]|uniref:tyrosine-protein phosphatase 69D n=1 Tax=Orussus abietinus TaxID=222816 RepID=UPI0006269704|nr:tyrosine-protein phosphatase 69D [Orussus abietinus]
MFRNLTPVAIYWAMILACLFTILTALDEAASTVTESVTPEQNTTAKLEIIVSQHPQGIEAGSTPSLLCRLSESGYIWWTMRGQNLTTIRESEFEGRVDLKKASRNDTGDYTCMARTITGESLETTINLRIIEPGRVLPTQDVRMNVLQPANLTCQMQGYPLSNFTWVKGNDTETSEHLRTLMTVTEINETHVETSLKFKAVTRKDNGTYECQANDYNRVISGHVSLFVTDVPQVSIDFMKAVGAGSIFLNWTVNDGNEPVTEYFIGSIKNGTAERRFYSERIGGGNSSYVLKGFESNTTYQISISAVNAIGTSHISNPRWITTLEKDPEFVPKVTVNGVTTGSITIGWTVPPPELREHVQYYNLIATNGDQKREAMYPAQPRTFYGFVDLESATTYKFKVAACSEYTKLCGNWSAEVNGTTMDGVASPPQNLSITCSIDTARRTSFISLYWAPPARPNGLITRYKVELSGVSHFRNDMGRYDIDHWGPKGKSVDVMKINNTRFEQVPANTNYTARVHGITRARSSGEEAIGTCTMPVTTPDKESMNMRTWRKIENEGRQLFQLYLPRISERNGPICCYRIFMVRLEAQRTVADLPPPEEIDVLSYQYAHASQKGGAYVAETFDSDQLLPEIFLGDGEVFNGSSACDKCVGLRPRVIPPLLNLVPEEHPPPTVSSTTPTTLAPIVTTSTTRATTVESTTGTSTTTSKPTTSEPKVPTSNVTGAPGRRKRADPLVPEFDLEARSEILPYPPTDGYLDPKSNYTGFIEVIVYGNQKDEYLPAYSGYFSPLYGGLSSKYITEQDVSTLGIIIQISVSLVLIMVALILAFCVLNKCTKRTRQRGGEIITLRSSFRHFCRNLRGRHQLVAASPPDIPPISKAELLQAYIERHRDSDYGFQHEFEMLPDRFTDRTTRASEARENLFKNRYPDIKCYDQTRVRLAQMDGICGSDYINANFVLGYKERKKFICAQGPMENTVCDYWRMIWEQHLEIILMLTNLEEYSKTKCAKYWPDKSESKNFGDITVEHIGERSYSDYVVRDLKMTRTGERDVRVIVQYHFLVWKDFMAPEHPHAILKFIKRVNEAYSLEKGPILVHCSAGVGRTGTLVALDSLLQQLAEENQVSIFNTVCDLRHQRNFLVQSLKQYIFIYRSLMEMAQYGDTEIPIQQLKATVEKLRLRDNGKEKYRMEEEYEKINSVLDDRKSFSVGCGEENKLKNRSEHVIPYDRNRVILTPVPGREHSTYINASFIEGYDNSETFVITQDPLDTTVADFWRMISEQCVSTIVMLSDLNDGPRKCPRYWPEEEAAYDHINVRYIQSESCPYYTRRELCVSNTKTDESAVVVQFQYHGWPTVEGEVPEVTRGLIELVDQTLANEGVESSGPLVIHCNYGSDRSSMFVALSILVQQLRTERRVDVFTTTKKLRSQRHGMISTFAQYELLYRAIMNYSDLHNLAEEEAASL